MKIIFVLFISIAIVFPSTVDAAKISFLNKGTGAAWVVLEGEIELGDNQRLITSIKNNPADFIVTRGIAVNSPGGSVAEAIDIARTIESSGMTLRVEEGDTCASACFILFASASYRWASESAKILIHRPYFRTPPSNSEEFASAMQAQQKAIYEMRDYLQSRSVPSSLIDKMMSYPSNDAYQVTIYDIYTGLGSMSPLLEELTSRKCGLTNSNMFQRGDAKADIRCIDSVLIDIKNDWLKNKIGSDKFKRALSEAMETLGA